MNHLCRRSKQILQQFTKKKNSMFRNILNLQKRHSTLAHRRQSDPIGKRTVKSIENLKINQINVANSKNDQNPAVKKDERRKGERLTFLKRDSNAYGKSGAKDAMKLQITPFYQRITLSTTNSLENQASNEIRQKIQRDIVPQVVDSSQSSNKPTNFFTYQREDFIKLLHKIFCLFLDAEEQQQDKTYLSKSLLNIKRIVLETNKSAMIKRHQIVAVSSLKINEGSFKDNLPRRRVSLEMIGPKKQMLSLEIDALTRKLQELKQQRKNIQEDIDSKKTRLTSITQKTNYILTYVQNQNRNKIVKVAGKHFRTIQADIHEYAAYLQANKLATSLTYEPVAQNIQQFLKQLKKELLQNSQLSLEEKFKMMRDFVLSLREEYHKKDVEQQKIIQFKTKCIITFVEKMKKWLDNWTLKQEYLVNLRNQFSVDSETFQSTFNYVFASKQDPASHELLSIYLKLKENYLMGNSFY